MKVQKTLNLLFRPSVLALLAANSVPLLGVLFLDFSLFQILFLYWFESAIVGFYYVLKVFKSNALIAIFYTPFFILHYGIFMVVHLSFIIAIFAPDLTFSSPLPPPDIFLPLIKENMVQIVALFISHGVSFFTNFIGSREYKNADTGLSYFSAYSRIIIMHITLLLGAALIVIFHAPIMGLVCLIIIKTIVDLYYHLREHSLKTTSLPMFEKTT